MSTKEVLSNCYIFNGFNGTTIESIEEISEMITLKGGERIFAKGDEATHLYIIGSGTVKLCLPISIMMSEQEVDFDEKKQGEMIGWSALIPPHELTMSAYAVEDCKLLRISGQKLRSLCESKLPFGFKVMSRVASSIADRLVQMDKMLAREIELNVPSM